MTITDRELVEKAYNAALVKSSRNNHLIAILLEARRDLPKDDWIDSKPTTGKKHFVVKVCETIFQLLPSLVKALNLSTSARLGGTTDRSVDFLISECLDVVRIVFSYPELAGLMKEFGTVIGETSATKAAETYVVGGGERTQQFFQRDKGPVSMYVQHHVNVEGMQHKSLAIFREIYLVGLLAMYWYDIIPVLLASESKVTTSKTNPSIGNKTALIIQRIIQSQSPVRRKEVYSGKVEWLYFIDRIELFKSAGEKKAIASLEASRELSNKAGMQINLPVAIKAATETSVNVNRAQGVYIPTQSVLQENQRESVYAVMTSIIQGLSSGTSSEPINIDSPSATVLDSMQKLTFPAQSFISSLLDSHDSNHEDEEEFEVSVSSRKLRKLMQVTSENA